MSFIIALESFKRNQENRSMQRQKRKELQGRFEGLSSGEYRSDTFNSDKFGVESSKRKTTQLVDQRKSQIVKRLLQLVIVCSVIVIIYVLIGFWFID